MYLKMKMLFKSLRNKMIQNGKKEPLPQGSKVFYCSCISYIRLSGRFNLTIKAIIQTKNGKLKNTNSFNNSFYQRCDFALGEILLGDCFKSILFTVKGHRSP